MNKIIPIFTLFFVMAGSCLTACSNDVIKTSSGEQTPLTPITITTKTTHTTSTPINTQVAIRNEKFITRIVSAAPYSGAMTIEILRCGDEVMSTNGDEITVTNPNGSLASQTKDEWMDGSETAMPVAGLWWNTSALIMLTDKQGNQIWATPESTNQNAKSDKGGNIIVSWTSNTKLLQRVNLRATTTFLGDLYPELAAAQQTLDHAYAAAKQTALNNAKAGQPYVAPNQNDYLLTDEQVEAICDKYINIQVVPYIQ
jgi:hypothetical protein